MVLVSLPRIFSVVRSLRTVSWVKRQKKNCCSPVCSNQSRAGSEWMCRLHKSASQTLASRKFNVFIDLFDGHVYLRTFGNDERKAHSLRTRTVSLQQDASDARQNQLAGRVTPGSCLLFQLPIKGGWNIHRGANRIVLHNIIFHGCHKYGRSSFAGRLSAK